MTIDFARSGDGLEPIRHASIRDVAETAIALGFVREDAVETGRAPGATGGREWIFSNVFRQLVVQL